jgi:hypothetical protein
MDSEYQRGDNIVYEIKVNGAGAAALQFPLKNWQYDRTSFVK